MSEREIENYVALVGSMLRLSRTQREEIGCELRDHLETRVDALTSAGYSADEAVKMALDEFGDAAGLAIQFVSVVQQQKRRWMMRFATFSILGVFAVIVFSMAMWPKNANFGAPGNAMAQEGLGNQEGGGDQDVSSPATSTPPKKSAAFAKTVSGDAKVFEENRTRNDKVEKALNEMTDIDFVETEFSNVISEWTDRHQVRFHVRQSARDSGLGEDELVTLRFSGVRFRTALKSFLEENDCAYAVVDGMLVIAEENDCPMAVRTFDCNQILANLTKSKSSRRRGVSSQRKRRPPANGAGDGIGAPSAGSASGGSASGGGGGFGGGGAGAGIGGDFVRGNGGIGGGGLGGGAPSRGGDFSFGSGNALGTLTTEEDQMELISLIERMVSPDSWVSSNGEGRLEFAGNILIVRQRGHELHQVGQFLDDLGTELKKQHAK